MLFKTVYGTELGSTYHYIAEQDRPPTKSKIYQAFLYPVTQHQSRQTIDDALAFLSSAYMIRSTNGHFYSDAKGTAPFHLTIIKNLRAVQVGTLTPKHPLDAYYLRLLEEIFIQPGQALNADVHLAANKLSIIKAQGGVSKEKIQAWRRVMAYLNIGHQIGKGFLALYAPTLVLDIIRIWHSETRTLQDFLETHFSQYLPYQTEQGELAAPLAESLLFLEQEGRIKLTTLQDSPGKSYFGDRRIKAIAYVPEVDDARN